MKYVRFGKTNKRDSNRIKLEMLGAKGKKAQTCKQSLHTQDLNVKSVSSSSKRRKKFCSKLKQRGLTSDSREWKQIFSFSQAGCV